MWWRHTDMLGQKPLAASAVVCREPATTPATLRLPCCEGNNTYTIRAEIFTTNTICTKYLYLSTIFPSQHVCSWGCRTTFGQGAGGGVNACQFWAKAFWVTARPSVSSSPCVTHPERLCSWWRSCMTEVLIYASLPGGSAMRRKKHNETKDTWVVVC